MKRFVTLLACTAVLVLAVGCGGEEPDAGSSAAGRDDALVAKAREIVRAVDEARWDDARKDFDANMRSQLTSDLLERSWEAYLKLFGEFRSQGEAEVVSSGTYKVVNIALDMADRDGQARVTFDEVERIAGLFFLKTGVPVPS